MPPIVCQTGRVYGFIIFKRYMTVNDIARAIEAVAPLPLQEDYDNAGIQYGDPRQEVSRVLVALDVTEETIAEARETGAGLIVSHHPLIFRPLRKITPRDYVSRTVIAAIRAGISLYAAHTNLDNADGGVNYRMAEVLGLENLSPLETLPAERTAGMAPERAQRCGSGLIGELPEALKETDFIGLVKKRFNCPVVKHNVTGRKIRKVALCGGAGGSFIPAALRHRADAYLTGEVGYHPFFGHPDLLIVEAGHYETEQFTCNLLREIIRNACPGVEVFITRKPANPVQVD